MLNCFIVIGSATKNHDASGLLMKQWNIIALPMTVIVMCLQNPLKLSNNRTCWRSTCIEDSRREQGSLHITWHKKEKEGTSMWFYVLQPC
jgi:hypothetical protein